MTSLNFNLVEPEEVLWECLENIPELPELQIATMLSLSLGAQHSYEARSLLWSLFRVLRPTRIIETGTNHGLTTAYLWKLGQTLGYSTELQTFDIAASKLAPQLWQRLGMSASVTFTQGDSAAEVGRVGVKGAEFVLIDGDHSYEGAERDWQAAEPLLTERCVILCDNMDHVAGCGRFFATLEPLWFHPTLAMVTRGLSDAEVKEIFAAYSQRLLPLWIAAMSGKKGLEVRRHLTLLNQKMQQEEAPNRAEQYEIAFACRQLSALAQHNVIVRESHLMRISARYDIGTLADARRTRRREAMPPWLHPIMSRAYRLIKGMFDKSEPEAAK